MKVKRLPTLPSPNLLSSLIRTLLVSSLRLKYALLTDPRFAAKISRGSGSPCRAVRGDAHINSISESQQYHCDYEDRCEVSGSPSSRSELR
jgi:mevalonate pyrophosphate decarboxylase